MKLSINLLKNSFFNKNFNLTRFVKFIFKANFTNNNNKINIFIMEKIGETDNSKSNANVMEVDSDADSIYVDDSGEQNKRKDNNDNNDNKVKESKKVVKEFDKDKRVRTDDKYVESEEKEENRDKLKLPKRKYAIIFGYLGHKYSGNQK